MSLKSQISKWLASQVVEHYLSSPDTAVDAAKDIDAVLDDKFGDKKSAVIKTKAIPWIRSFLTAMEYHAKHP